MNRALFSTHSRAPVATAQNEAGGLAYEKDPRTALATYACTGCLGGTFYASAEEQLDTVLQLAIGCPPEFVAKTAIYARQKGLMKDMPALLLAFLAARASELFVLAAPHVLDNGRMVRGFVQICRSGRITFLDGRIMRSIPRPARRFLRRWLQERPFKRLFNEAVGQTPSVRDMIKLLHPKPVNDAQRALWGYLRGKPYQHDHLPRAVQEFEAWKQNGLEGAPPDIEFRHLTPLPLRPEHWEAIALRAPWQMTRMNLVTFKRHGAMDNKIVRDTIVERLRDAEQIRRARVFPYQLLMAWKMSYDMHSDIQGALQDAADLAVANVPALPGPVVVCPDVSGSMNSPVTGHRGKATKVNCVEVAALVAAAVLRRNPDALVLPFDTDVYTKLRLNPRDSLVTLTRQLTINGGGTAVSVTLKEILERKLKPNLVWIVSDNQSWADYARGPYDAWARPGTFLQDLWKALKRSAPHAKLVLHDLQPVRTSQAQDGQSDVLHVGGFSDAVFSVVEQFAQSDGSPDQWVRLIEEVPLT